jgi:hypothetical protein
MARGLRSGSLRDYRRGCCGVVAQKTFIPRESLMIAGLLALMLVSADTTMRFPSPTPDSLLASAAVNVDTLPAPRASVPDSLAVRALPFAVLHERTDSDLRLVLPRADTTVKKKRKLVEYSEWYGRRLAVHKTLSWAMLPLFAISYYTGERLARDGRIDSPSWVRTAHPVVATTDAVIFGVNTVTGLWNLWDARHDPEGRTRRIIHSVLFIAADAGFAYAGSIGKDARDDGNIRSRHRAVALSSIGVSTVGWLIMLIGQ